MIQLSRRVSALILLAALALPVSALMITQTHTFLHDNLHDISSSGQGSVNTGGFWFYQPFNSALGTLQSVTVEGVSNVTVSGTDVNHYYLIPYIPPAPITR